jgi:hypothetical protein
VVRHSLKREGELANALCTLCTIAVP